MPATLPAPPPHGSSEMMIRRLIRVALALAMVGAATPAFAIDASFYTYDGFAETVDAFRLVAMIFADPRYETLVIVIATVGISLGALLASVREIGRASCRERVCQYVLISVVAVSLKKKTLTLTI